MGGRVTNPGDGAVYVGDVVHKRARPKRHSLRYRVFSMLVDLDRLSGLDARLKLFSVGHFNLFSLRLADFGPHDGSSLADFVRAKADAAGVGKSVKRIRMLCYPRILGYAFNPLTVYYLEDGDGRIVMLIFEVHNTFGEHHFYDAVLDSAGDAKHELALPKRFYVSPFNTLAGTYRFVVRPPTDAVFTGITLSDEDGPLVTAYFAGQRRRLTDGTLLRLAVAYPLMTLKVIAAIYWEAFRLWIKGVPLTLAVRQPK